MTHYFTSDLHLGHKGLVEKGYRPFASVEEMNRTLIDNWNDTVGDDDEVFILGDLCMGQLAESLPLVAKLRGTKRLVPGNHDRMHPAAHTKPHRIAEFIERYEEQGLIIMHEQVNFQVAPWEGHTLLCHFPSYGDHTHEERYTEHRPDSTDYDVLLHGHVHDAWQMRDNMVNVGVDVWNFAPVSIWEIDKLVGTCPDCAWEYDDFGECDCHRALRS